MRRHPVLALSHGSEPPSTISKKTRSTRISALASSARSMRQQIVADAHKRRIAA
jgi:hypothetical protein